MSFSTITIEEIERLPPPWNNIFNFSYEWEEVDGVKKEDLEQGFKEYWQGYEIVEETIQSFQRDLAKKWRTGIKPLNKLLKIQPKEYSLENHTRTHTLEGDGDTLYSDTPNEELPTLDTSGYLTDRTKTNTKLNESVKEYNNSVEQFAKISKQAIDIVMEFYKQFVDLFDTSIIVRNFVMNRFNRRI